MCFCFLKRREFRRFSSALGVDILEFSGKVVPDSFNVSDISQSID